MEAIKQHQMMAQGKGTLPNESFGVQGFAEMQGKAGNKSNGMLADHQRASPPPIEGNQANARHGSHTE